MKTDKALKKLLQISFVSFTQKHHGILTMPEIQTLAKFIQETQETYENKISIACSAIWYQDLETQHHLPKNLNKGVVVTGLGHAHCIHTMLALTGKRTVEIEVGKYVQGFLTNHNTFLNREEAAIIAFEAGQILVKKKELYSEDFIFKT